MLIQASAVARDGRAILITGEPGSGKSSLALALIERGSILIGDDGVSLDRRDGALLASPPPTIAGLLEVRGVCLLEMPTMSAPVRLVVALGKDGERLPEVLPITTLDGLPIPTLQLAQLDWTTPMRVELALEKHGLA